MTAATGAGVQVERHGAAAVLRLDNPPVNTLSRPVRAALLAALEEVEHDPTITSVVLLGAGSTFSAGADLREFDSGEGLAEPTLHLTIAGFLDAMRTPVVAAIEGVALGGGLELALACHHRVAGPGATLGLPETTLGFMPGAGGTQRLPRAVGLVAATNLILTGRAVGAEEALALGLVDDVVRGDFLDGALAHAAASAGRPPRRLRDEPLDEPLAEPYLAAVARSLRRGPLARPGSASAVEALKATALPFDEGLAVELRLFRTLAETPAASAFRYRFLAERRAGRVARVDRPLPAVRQAGVIGAGTMGRGIALALLGAGIPTVLVEPDADRLADAVAEIARELDRAVARGRLEPGARAEQLAALTDGTGPDAVAGCDVVVEAVFEDLAVKRQVFTELDRLLDPAAVLASNTSSLDPDRIADATRYPDRVVGLHFFSPAHVMRLVEVVPGARTSPAVLAAATALVRRLGKVPVVAQPCDGFIGNRMLDQYVRQALLLVRRGARPEQVDGALERWGMAMGPFRALDLVGNDIPFQARRARFGEATGGPEWALADELVARGWLGRKTGRGWYRYDTGRPTAHAELAELLPGEGRREITDGEIVDRCILALVNEGAALVSEGVAARPSDVDVVFLNGYGFPAARGGPLFHADGLGLDRVVRTMRRFADDDPADPFWTPSPLLLDAAARGARLTDGSN